MYCKVIEEACLEVPNFVNEYRGDRGQKAQYTLILCDEQQERKVVTISYWDVIQYCIWLLNNPFYTHGFTCQDISPQQLLSIRGINFKDVSAQKRVLYWKWINQAFSDIKDMIVNEFLQSQEYAARLLRNTQGQNPCNPSTKTPLRKISLHMTSQECTIGQKIIQEGYRKLARKYHPDCGGSTSDMQVVNRTKAKLIDSLCHSSA